MAVLHVLGVSVAVIHDGKLDALKSATFKSVTPAGADIYEVTFEHGVREFHILVESDGRSHSAWFSN